MVIELVDIASVKFNEFISTDSKRFSLWPVSYSEEIYHKNRLKKIKAENIRLFGYFEKNEIQAILELQLSDYDTKLWGFKCSTVSNIFLRNELPDKDVKIIIDGLIDALNSYRVKENIRFCLFAINNWDTKISMVAQNKGFKYMLSWGSCFFKNDFKKKYNLPDFCSVTDTKNEEWLMSYYEMVEYYFKGGRFYIDDIFEKKKVDKMYRDLISNCFYSDEFEFQTLLNKKNEPVCFTISKSEKLSFNETFEYGAFRFLLADIKKMPKNMGTAFFYEASVRLCQKFSFITSGIELHNLPSMAIHNNCGYKFNYVYSAYHSFL